MEDPPVDTTDHLSQLDDDELLHLLGNLNLQDLCRFMQVSKRCMEGASRHVLVVARD